MPSYLSIFLYILEYLYERFLRLLNGDLKIDEESVHSKIALVTGANSGLGKEVALALAERGCKVILACRNLIQGRLVVDEIRSETGCLPTNLILRELDLADLSSVRRFAESVREEFPEIHILVNNAGVYFDCDERQVTKDGFEIHMGVNHLGHFLLTNLLLDNLKRAAPSRIITVTSTNQLIASLSLEDLMLERAENFGFQNTIPYNNSKLANSLFMWELGRRLVGTGVTTYSVCPGLVATECFRNFTPFRKFYTNLNLLLVGLTPKQGSETILYCALSKRLRKETGKVFRFGKHFTSAMKKLDSHMSNRLWEISQRLVNLK